MDAERRIGIAPPSGNSRSARVPSGKVLIGCVPGGGVATDASASSGKGTGTVAPARFAATSG